jgi:hypothetical protein
LQVVKIRPFCQRLQWIRFCDEDEATYDSPSDFGENFDDERPGRWTRIASVKSPKSLEDEFFEELNRSARAIAVEASGPSDINHSRASDEEVEILAECFRHLKLAKNLQCIKLCSAYGHDGVIRGMSLASFSPKVVVLTIDVAYLTRVGYGKLSDNPQDYSKYVKGLKINPSYATDPNDYWIDEQERSIPWGAHIKNFRPTTTTLTKLVSALINIESLTICGCRIYHSIRLCHGCDDLFAKNFALTFYPQLGTLNLNHVFMSGGRLRRFIKRHSNSLFEVNMVGVVLTDGSWRSIAQGLAKLPELRGLRLSSLRQKHRELNDRPPSEYHNVSRISLHSRSHIHDFLTIAVEYFSTVQCSNPDRFRRRPPKYHQAKLFEPPFPQDGVDSGDRLAADEEE